MTRDIDLVVTLAGQEARAVAAPFQPDYYVSEVDIGRAFRSRPRCRILWRLLCDGGKFAGAFTVILPTA